MRYRVLGVDGKERAPEIRGARPSLEELQGVVGGYIERLTVPGGWLWVNEDGISKELPVNRLATDLAGQVILGDVLYCERSRRGSGR